MQTPEPEGQLKKRHKYLLREENELHTIKHKKYLKREH